MRDRAVGNLAVWPEVWSRGPSRANPLTPANRSVTTEVSAILGEDMSEESPSLEQYPGYYPPGSKKFWTRPKVGAVTGVVGLIFGLSLGTPTEADPATNDSESFTQADIDAAVEDATSELDERLQAKEAVLEQQEARAAKAEAKAQRQQARAVKNAIAKTRREERARAAKQVAAARQEATQEAQKNAAPQPLASTGTDPQFSYCYEANDAGYGPYYQGQDPEYDWYDDADGDGVVCES